MLYGLLLTLFVIVAIFLILIILVQQSKGSIGVGGFGGQAQMFFGGSGGQDLFQKITWGFVTFFMATAMLLALLKSGSQGASSRYITQRTSPLATQPVQPSEQKTTHNSQV